MRATTELLILASFLLLCSCKKQGEGVNDNGNNFKVGIKVNSLICYPYDNISLSFFINVENGSPPYSYKWIEPESFSGPGPFTIKVKSDLLLKLEVSDAIIHKVTYRFVIRKDTIDSLKYDYRNKYIGDYACEVIYHETTIGPGGVITTQDTTYHDTITVSKHAQFDMLNISHIPEVTYDPKKSNFVGSRTTVTFKGDNIDAYYYQTPIALINWTYRGVKINTLLVRRN